MVVGAAVVGGGGGAVVVVATVVVVVGRAVVVVVDGRVVVVGCLRPASLDVAVSSGSDSPSAAPTPSRNSTTTAADPIRAQRGHER